ncbi:MAG: 5-formyltetrahydrofolate cyclo-ligase [Nitratireductor sp.]|nr:5-formyltetrahydrofolate cyclo-ligase [Nitratireductor sp.]
MTLKDEKSRLRSEVLARRDAIDPAGRIEWSLRAGEIAAENIRFEPGTIVSGFLPIRSEIDARPLMDTFRQRGARLCLPVVVDRTTIVFRELVRGAELVSTGFGTSGPGPDAAVLDPELLLMPLSVFDRRGGRIGYGAGHYDRAIGRLLNKGINPRLAGFAFSCQEVGAVPLEAHDKLLDCVITEKEFIEPAA